MNSTTSARYLVFEETFVNGVPQLNKVHCSSIKEVRKALVGYWSKWSTTTTAHLTISNGYYCANLPAAMVATQAKRQGRCIVAINNYPEGRREIGVIPLFL